MTVVETGGYMDRNRWIIFGLICIAIFGVLILNRQGESVNVDNIDASKVVSNSKKEKDEIADHTFGSESKKVLLIEYGDFQCPGCGSLYPSLKPLKEHYKDQLTFVFRNFPLTTIHPNALAASSAAEAAGLQGKFWEYHDILYERQDDWSNSNTDERGTKFEGYAKELDLNIDTFRKDVESEKVSAKIKRDQALGKKIGATATPTLVLNGKTLAQNEWQTGAELEDTLRSAIQESGQELPSKLND